MEEYICPHCQNPIYDDDALLCHFCGESLHRPGKGFLSNIKYSEHRVIWFFLLFFALLGFILVRIF